MRSIKTEGAVAERRRNDCGSALHALSAFRGMALVVVELCDETLEGTPEGVEACAGVGEAVVGGEAADGMTRVGEFAGA